MDLVQALVDKNKKGGHHHELDETEFLRWLNVATNPPAPNEPDANNITSSGAHDGVLRLRANRKNTLMNLVWGNYLKGASGSNSVKIKLMAVYGASFKNAETKPAHNFGALSFLGNSRLWWHIVSFHLSRPVDSAYETSQHKTKAMLFILERSHIKVVLHRLLLLPKRFRLLFYLSKVSRISSPRGISSLANIGTYTSPPSSTRSRRWCATQGPIGESFVMLPRIGKYEVPET